MKYKITLKQGFTTIGEGELIADLAPLRRPAGPNLPSDVDVLRRLLLEMEMAINAHTEIRVHLEEIESYGSPTP